MRLLLTGLFGLLLVAPGPAADYAKVDRTLKKEPAYQSKSPRKAKVSPSFPEWKAGQVGPATGEVAVTKPVRLAAGGGTKD